jgi:hypothetical protein
LFFVRRRRRRRRRSNVNDDGKMTMEKKVMTTGRRSKKKDRWGKVILIGIFQSPPCMGRQDKDGQDGEKERVTL